jgi:glyoxylase-like metal-dependent hydrolase (beta-lactamase superfamily II)
VAAAGRVIELAPGIYSLGHGKGGHVHAFLVETGGELSLVDTLFEDDARLVLQAIHELGRAPTDLKRIAITHGHRSHLGGLATLKRESGATVYAHRWEADIVSGDRRAQAVSILPQQSLKLIPFQLGLWLNRPKHVPCPVDELLGEGDRFGPFEVLHASGHSPGHLAFSWAEQSFAIVGDAVATWPSLCPGWHAFNLNKKQHHVTLQRLAALGATIVGVGHGDPITHGARDVLDELASKPVP